MDTVIQANQPAPGFSLPDLDGRLHRLEETRGLVLVINFWSAECPWVERTDHEMQRLLAGWGKTVRYWPIASNVNEPVDLLRRVAQQRALPLVLYDSQHQVASLFGAQTTPHFFVLDGSGFLRYQGGFDDVTFRKRTPEVFYLRDAVEALAAGILPDPAATLAYGCSIVWMA